MREHERMPLHFDAGDAKCVLGRLSEEGGQTRAITLTREHMALFPDERVRIEKAGGWVSKDGRLCDRVEVSRAFGDALYKAKGMSVIPDMKVCRGSTLPQLPPLHCKAGSHRLLCECPGIQVVDPGQIHAVGQRRLLRCIQPRRCSTTDCTAAGRRQGSKECVRPSHQ